MMKIVERAREFATQAHEGQVRKYTGVPYIVHPIEVMEIVCTVEHDDAMLAAALLHDVVEDTEHTIDEGWGAVTGPGVGMQVTFWDNMLFRFELPLGFRYGSDGFGIMPLPNTALMYRW